MTILQPSLKCLLERPVTDDLLDYLLGLLVRYDLQSDDRKLIVKTVRKSFKVNHS